MSRPKDTALHAARQRILLEAIAAHPWARAEFLSAMTNLSRNALKRTMAQMGKTGLVESARLKTSKRNAPARFGLTPRGAFQLGRAFPAPFWRTTLLSSLRFEPARRLLTRLHREMGGLVWSLSPFTVPADAVRPPFDPRRRPAKGKVKGRPFVSLPFEALAAVRLGDGEYLNVAILADPGGVDLEWFAPLFRSAAAWQRRSEFHDRPRAYPLLIVVAANAMRREALGRLWRRAFRDHVAPLRTTTWKVLGRAQRSPQPFSEWRWWNEHNQPATLFGGLWPRPAPSARPAAAHIGWWGESEVTPLPAPDPPQSERGVIARMELAKANPPTDDEAAQASEAGRRSLLPARARRKNLAAHLTRALVEQAMDDYLHVSAVGRWLLSRFGAYPLARLGDLTVVLNKRYRTLGPALAELETRSLIRRDPATEGFSLTWRGVTLLALAAGFMPRPYAALCRWPVGFDERGLPTYSLNSLSRQPQHTRQTLAFLVGLCRYGRRAGLALLLWEHLACLQVEPDSGSLMPDACGRARVFIGQTEQSVDTPFWLEIDNHTILGQSLTEKLERYYRVGGPRPGALGRQERLLIVTPADDEARLQGLRRRLRNLDATYRVHLDVRLTRLDLLDTGHGLDPTRPVWRTLDDSTFGPAFTGLTAKLPKLKETRRAH